MWSAFASYTLREAADDLVARHPLSGDALSRNAVRLVAGRMIAGSHERMPARIIWGKESALAAGLFVLYVDEHLSHGR